MNNKKVSDMNKNYIINFLQEYSYYIKLSKEPRNLQFIKNLKCPTEFFNSNYLAILEETKETEEAFKDD